MMRRALRSLAWVAVFATFFVAGALALSPDDAIDLTQQGADDYSIIQKIVADGDAWDLSDDDIGYLHDQGVSDDVINALIDPEAAAEQYGLDYGQPQDDYGYAPAPAGSRTAYVFSLGYYYGPLARFYYYDPFFYDYLYCDNFAFSYSTWPSYFSNHCWPYSYGYYAYPYFWYPYGSNYYGFGYCGDYYVAHYTPPPGARFYYGNVRYRDDLANGTPAWGSNRPIQPVYRYRNGSGSSWGFDTGAGRRLAYRDPARWERGGGSLGERVTDGRLRSGDPRDAVGVRARDGWTSRRYDLRNRAPGGVQGEPRVIRGRGALAPRDPGRAFQRRDPMSDRGEQRLRGWERRANEAPRNDGNRQWRQRGDAPQRRSEMRVPEARQFNRGYERRQMEQAPSPRESRWQPRNERRQGGGQLIRPDRGESRQAPQARAQEYRFSPRQEQRAMERPAPRMESRQYAPRFEGRRMSDPSAPSPGGRGRGWRSESAPAPQPQPVAQNAQSWGRPQPAPARPAQAQGGQDGGHGRGQGRGR